jgi:hypothetical protein
VFTRWLKRSVVPAKDCHAETAGKWDNDLTSIPFRIDMQNQYRWLRLLAIWILAVALASAAVAAALTAALRAHPGLVLLVRPGFKSRTPFCSIWHTK